MSDDALNKLFEKAKSYDLTQFQFEAEKTKRICALSEALKSLTQIALPNDYSLTGQRGEVVDQLMRACNSQYSGEDTRFL